MMNLAGRNRPKAENDKQICMELLRCGIEAAPWECGDSEVVTGVCGVVPILPYLATFTRAWTYWVVSCRVPVEMAKRIYKHPVGHTDIRVGGHCGCIAPEAPYVEWRDHATGRKYASTKEREQIEGFKEKYPDMYTKFMAEHLFHDDPESIGAVGTVDSYHIDTELGLYVFALFLKGRV